MSFNLLWVFAIVFSYIIWETNGQLSIDLFGDSSSSSSDSLSIFGDFELNDKPFIEVRNMILESRSMVMNILRGKQPEAITKQIELRYPKLTKFFTGVSQSARLCLKNYGSQSERIQNAALCFTEAVRNRQAENEDEIEEEEDGVQDCLQEVMIEAATEAASIIVAAQDAYQRFRQLMTQTGRKMMMCRGDVRPFECMRKVWADGVKTLSELRDEAAEILNKAQELITNYVDNMRYCLTPVEEEEEEEYSDEKKGQKVTTEFSKCLNENEYDGVDPDPETRTQVKNCDDTSVPPDTGELS